MRVCSSCGTATFRSFLEFGMQPRTGIYLAERGAARAPRTRLDLEYCENCGFIRQIEKADDEIDYAEVERGTAQQLPHYASELIDRLRAQGISNSSFVIEVGCNEGSFLEVLRDSGFVNLVGIEPSLSLSQASAGKGFRVEPVPLTIDMAGTLVEKYGLADAVVCRHTLEHVPEPAELIAAICKIVKPGGICLIEVPDTDWIIKYLYIHEVWDEHVSYFRPSSLHRMLKRQGLNVIQLDTVRFRDTRNLVCFAVRGPTDDEVGGVQDDTNLADIADCATRWAGLVEKLHREIEIAPRPLIAIGASHIQLNFLSFAKLQDQVTLLIDDDPRKTNRFAPIGGGVPIISTNQAIEQITQGTLLRTAFPYPAWMDALGDALSARGVAVIDPYRLR